MPHSQKILCGFVLSCSGQAQSCITFVAHTLAPMASDMLRKPSEISALRVVDE